MSNWTYALQTCKHTRGAIQILALPKIMIKHGMTYFVSITADYRKQEMGRRIWPPLFNLIFIFYYCVAFWPLLVYFLDTCKHLCICCCQSSSQLKFLQISIRHKRLNGLLCFLPLKHCKHLLLHSCGFPLLVLHIFALLGAHCLLMESSESETAFANCNPL